MGDKSCAAVTFPTARRARVTAPTVVNPCLMSAGDTEWVQFDGLAAIVGHLSTMTEETAVFLQHSARTLRSRLITTGMVAAVSVLDSKLFVGRGGIGRAEK